MLEAAAERNLPMVVANPDLVTVGGDAGLLPMPGTLARRYREIRPDADVILTGKPARCMYDAAFATLAAAEGSCSEDASEGKSSFGVEGLPGSAVAVGDSLEHDVKGAAGAGVDSVFVCGGIHADELGMDPGGLTAEAVGDGSGVESPGADAVARVAERHGATPTHSSPSSGGDARRTTNVASRSTGRRRGYRRDRSPFIRLVIDHSCSTLRSLDYFCAPKSSNSV